MKKALNVESAASHGEKRATANVVLCLCVPQTQVKVGQDHVKAVVRAAKSEQTDIPTPPKKHVQEQCIEWFGLCDEDMRGNGWMLILTF